MKELQNLQTLNAKNLLVVLPINKLEDALLNDCAYSLANSKYPIDVLVLAKNTLTEDENIIIKNILEQPVTRINKKSEEGVVTQDIIKSEKGLNYNIVITDKELFSEVFNESFNYSLNNEYKYFSIVEPDDLVYDKWYDYFNLYSEEKSDFDGYLPLTREVSNGNFIGFFNESCWYEGFSEVAGTYDLQMLLRFNCMNITGGVFKISRALRN